MRQSLKHTLRLKKVYNKLNLPAVQLRFIILSIKEDESLWISFASYCSTSSIHLVQLLLNYLKWKLMLNKMQQNSRENTSSFLSKCFTAYIVFTKRCSIIINFRLIKNNIIVITIIFHPATNNSLKLYFKKKKKF